MKKRIVLVLTAVLLAALVFAGCSGESPDLAGLENEINLLKNRVASLESENEKLKDELALLSRPDDMAIAFDGFTQIEVTSEFTVAVSNSTDLLDLNGIAKVNSNSTWKLTTDINGGSVIENKIVSLLLGDNTFYIFVTAESGSVKRYKMKIRRLEIYTVNFYETDGMLIAHETVEEGSFVESPEVPPRAGYTLSWDYDFTKAVTSHTDIEARWQANTYKVFFHANNGTDEMLIQDIKFDDYFTIWGDGYLADSSKFENKDYSFYSWNTKADGTGELYGTTDGWSKTFKYIVVGDLHLYAIWR